MRSRLPRPVAFCLVSLSVLGPVKAHAQSAAETQAIIAEALPKVRACIPYGRLLARPARQYGTLEWSPYNYPNDKLSDSPCAEAIAAMDRVPPAARDQEWFLWSAVARFRHLPPIDLGHSEGALWGYCDPRTVAWSREAAAWLPELLVMPFGSAGAVRDSLVALVGRARSLQRALEACAAERNAIEDRLLALAFEAVRTTHLYGDEDERLGWLRVERSADTVRVFSRHPAAALESAKQPFPLGWYLSGLATGSVPQISWPLASEFDEVRLTFWIPFRLVRLNFEGQEAKVKRCPSEAIGAMQLTLGFFPDGAARLAGRRLDQVDVKLRISNDKFVWSERGFVPLSGGRRDQCELPGYVWDDSATGVKMRIGVVEPLGAKVGGVSALSLRELP